MQSAERSRAKALQATTSTWCRVDTQKSDERLQMGIRESCINLDTWFYPRFVSRPKRLSGNIGGKIC